ncbi:SpoIIE family protein phosphatase [Maridesulfovibrio frigidus]|uniref:SpoIIE family protein phosphatase n=1 Tax=Maridesulfovibrio frigidus TaxID=340956 RepID=UPI0004E21406|nr:SpoIIE family protein phosphatase [Maridesulfovibrio frigidus]
MAGSGVTEAENSTKELFGDERVMNVLLTSNNILMGDKLAEAVRIWRNGAEQNDDTTIVEILRS